PLVTVQFKTTEPLAPAVKVIVVVFVPAVIEPPVIVQAYVAPTPAVGTEAVLTVELAQTLEGAVIVELGIELIVMVWFCDPPLEQPAPLVTVQFKTTLPLALAEKVILVVPEPAVI